MSEHQPALPRLPLSLVRAAAPWKRPAAATTALPDTRSEIDGWQPERERLAQYRALVGSDAEVPLAYPQVPIMAVHMDLLSRWSHPVRAMGLVHQGSVVEALDELPTDQPWDLRAWGSAGRHVRSGMEWDMWGEVRVAGRLRWRSRAVYLSRSRRAAGAEESTVPALTGDGPWDSETVLPVEEGTGRAFGRITGDVNPIHLHAASARLFGFPRAIAHGWWTTARTTAVLDVDESVPGRTLEMVFRRPVLLPSEPSLCVRREPGDSGGGAVVDFALVRTGGSGAASAGEAAGASAEEVAEESAVPLHIGRVTG